MAGPFRHDNRYHTTDLDRAREVVARSLCPHDLRLLRRNGGLKARMWSHRLRNVSISDIAYGDDVEIVPGCLGSFFVVQIPLAGSGAIRCGTQEIHSRVGIGSVPDPYEPLSMRWTGDCEQRVVRFEQAALEAHLADMLGHPLQHGRLTFELGMDLRTGEGRAFDEEIDLVTRRLERDPAAYDSAYLLALQEQLLMSRLLLATQHSYSNELNGKPPAASSSTIRLVIDLMHNQAEQPHTLADLARAAGVSTRTLEREFLRHMDMSPMAYYRGVRLDRVRDALRVADPHSTTVGLVARGAGFLNRGRFAADYRRRHGESPSETLQR